MRAFLALVLSVCSGTSAPPAAPPMPSTDPVIQDFVDHATLVVRGVARVRSQGTEYTGTISLDTIYKGAASPSIPFVSEPFDLIDHDAIFFLASDGAGRWRITLTGPRAQGLASLEEPRVIAAIHDQPGSPAQLAADLATFRAGFGKPWLPANAPAVDAAERIFDTVPWIGASPADLTKLLGKPDKVDEQHRWQYIRHTGEAGVMRYLRIQGDRVVAVEIVLTQ